MTLPERENKSTLNYAYDIEGQAIAVSSAQVKGELELKYAVLVVKATKHDEAGLEWYALSSGSILYAGDCNEELMQELIHVQKLQVLRTIQTATPKPEVFWGKERRMIAAVLLGDRSVLYKSPGFNLEAYQRGGK